MDIELSGATYCLLGEENEVAMAASSALAANGGIASQEAPDILIASFPLLPRDDLDVEPLLAEIEALGVAMQGRGSGRIVFLVSAAAAIPMRRHADYSARLAMVHTHMRTLAMRLAPQVLVNALGVGAIGTPLIAGDAAMLGHASIKRPGTVDEAVSALLFFCDPLNTYTTGQLLSVDGGWSAGYGRSF
jgi:hypothetical protein